MPLSLVAFERPAEDEHLSGESAGTTRAARSLFWVRGERYSVLKKTNQSRMQPELSRSLAQEPRFRGVHIRTRSVVADVAQDFVKSS
jgi:hypothetical protein